MEQKKLSYIWKYKALYLMVLPGILYFVVFKYVPLAGIIIAFQDYNVFSGIRGSSFVGFKHFATLFGYAEFFQVLWNTISINIYDMVIGFTAPIILALMIHEITSMKFKRVVQQTVYLPHFLSWTILGGIITTQVLSPEYGLINMFLQWLEREPIYFLIKPEMAKQIVVSAGVWRDTGWGTIIYLAALAGVNPNLYEAASIDGAGKIKQMWYITLPSLLSIVMILFLLKIGHFLDFGFERVWVFRNPANRQALEIFDTYIFQYGMLELRYSFSTAVGLFKSVVGLLLLFVANKLSLKAAGESLF